MTFRRLLIPLPVLGIALIGFVVPSTGIAQQAQGGQKAPSESAAPRPAQSEAPDSGQASLSEQDVHFVARAMEGGRLEVMLGRIASEQASSPEVAKFGQRMVRDHSKAGKKLKQIVSKLKIQPDLPTDRMANLRDELSKLSGDSFDRQYMWNMVAAHTIAVNLFEEQVREGDNPMLVKFAQQALTTLKDHRKQALEIWRDVG